jgi:hypothetical protein
MSAYRHSFVLAAALAAAVGLAGTPAHAIINHNALTHNALNPNALTTNPINHNALTATAPPADEAALGASGLDDLNGVAVEAVMPPQPSMPPQHDQVVGIVSPR